MSPHSTMLVSATSCFDGTPMLFGPSSISLTLSSGCGNTILAAISMTRYVISLPRSGLGFIVILQINKTADRMYALLAICSALSPMRVDDNISNIVKERYGEQFTKMSRG